MFAKRIAVLLAFMLAAMLLGIRPAWAETRTAFTMSGPTTFIRWTTTGFATPGDNWHAWDGAAVHRFTTTDPRFGGEITLAGNFPLAVADHPMPGWGPVNSTWTLDVDGDGIPDWEGTEPVLKNYQPVHISQLVGHGLGRYDGLQVSAWVYSDIDRDCETMMGVILDPHGQ